LRSNRLDIGSCIWSFDLYQNRWPWMAKWLLFCVIFFRGALRKSGWQSQNYRQFTITMSSSKRLQRERATPTV